MKQMHFSLKGMYLGEQKRPNERWKVVKKDKNYYGVFFKNHSGEYVEITDLFYEVKDGDGEEMEVPFLWITFMSTIH